MVERLKADGARAEHVAALDRLACPRSNFDAALCELLGIKPRTGLDGATDGRRAAMLSALDGRATWDQIRHWRRDNARAPQWALDLLDRRLSEKENGAARVRALIRKAS